MKKIIILTLLSFLIAGSAGALVYHIKDAKQNIVDERVKQVDFFMVDINQKIKNDTMEITELEINRIKEETEKRTSLILGEIYQRLLNEKTEEIILEADRVIEEINNEIDLYIESRLGELL